MPSMLAVRMAGFITQASGALPPAPAVADLRALATKYRALADLRSRRDGDGAPATKHELRALADEFPGCLRELDTLGEAEIARRARACDAAAAGAATQPWLSWIWCYHCMLRAALALKRGAPDRKPLSAARLKAHAEALSRSTGLALTPAFAAAVLHPPRGRLGSTIVRAVAELFAVPAPMVTAALMPSRRPGPSQPTIS